VKKAGSMPAFLFLPNSKNEIQIIFLPDFLIFFIIVENETKKYSNILHQYLEIFKFILNKKSMNILF
jgi:hypothetical protein